MDDLRQALEIDDHKIALSELYQRYDTDPKTGLTDAKAEEIFNRDGPNILSRPKAASEWMKCCQQIFGGFALLYWICASLCFIVHGLTPVTFHDNASVSYLWFGIVLIVVVIGTGFFSYIQESKSSRLMDSMRNLVPQRALVIRNGKKKQINIEDLVQGDIVEINAGDSITADVRIIESSGFKVDNSSLTGESEPQLRSTEFTYENPLETKNLAFRSTLAKEGTAKGLVIRTGDYTVIGHITNSISNQFTGEVPITKEISRSISSVTRVAVILGLSFFIIALSLGYPLIESFILLIVVIIATAPKGLSITVMICLALIAKRMARKNCLVKKLEAVETLGSTSIICVDKTGVLTQNEMTVAHAWFDNRIVEVDLSGNQGLSTFDENSATFLALARCITLCNRANFKQDAENLARPALQRECTGDPTEIALLKCVTPANVNVSEVRQINPKVCEIPFNSTNKYDLSIHESQGNSRPYLLVMKGAPERILERCSTIYIDGEDTEMNEYWRVACQRACSELGNLGERILAFCDFRFLAEQYPLGYSFDADEVNFSTENLRFLGLMSLIDPLKRSVPNTIMICRSAGIKVIMVTGDHPVTAKTIARTANIISNDSETVEDISERLGISVESVNSSDAKACVIHGNDLKYKSPAEVDALLRDYTEIVFARTSPQQKVLIVEACQRQGAIATMIGDGINDSRALQQADVGVAMGIAGSSVTKQAGEIILIDDNFSSIVAGVEQGRLMFDNLKKSIAYTMTSNIAKVISVLICLLTTVPLAWGITAVLCIDFINITGAISLAYEKVETDIMKRPPRNPKHTPLMNKRPLLIFSSLIGIIQVVAGFFAYFSIMNENGLSSSSYPFGLGKTWESKNINNLQNSYGQESTDKQLEFSCYAAFIITIIICQWATLIIFKTGRDSILQQNISNLMLNSGMIFATILVAIISYIIYSNTTLDTYPLKLGWWFPALFYVVLILILDEVRKYIIRKHPGGVVEKETCY